MVEEERGGRRPPLLLLHPLRQPMKDRLRHRHSKMMSMTLHQSGEGKGKRGMMIMDLVDGLDVHVSLRKGVRVLPS